MPRQITRFANRQQERDTEKSRPKLKKKKKGKMTGTQKREETQFFWLQPVDWLWKWWVTALHFFIESVLTCDVSAVFFNTILMEEMAFKSGWGWGQCFHRCVFEVVSLSSHPQNVELPDVFSPELKSLLEGLLQRDVSKRLGCHGGG